MVESDIHLLVLADGIIDALINAGFSTITSILKCTTSDLSNKIGVNQYVAQIIFEEAKRITSEMTKVPLVLDDSTSTAPAVAVKKEEIL
jgi:phage-related protein